MFAAFAKLRELQLLRAIAGDRPDLADVLDPPQGWTLEAVAALDLAAVRERVRVVLARSGEGRPTRASGWRSGGDAPYGDALK